MRRKTVKGVVSCELIWEPPATDREESVDKDDTAADLPPSDTASSAMRGNKKRRRPSKNEPGKKRTRLLVEQANLE